MKSIIIYWLEVLGAILIIAVNVVPHSLDWWIK
jgi:hypothetical protein